LPSHTYKLAGSGWLVKCQNWHSVQR
jgi:hypothetical protein